MFDGMKHIGTVISDFERSLDFYCGTLGMKVSYGPFVSMGREMAEAFDQRGTATAVPFGVDQAAFLRYSDDPGESVVDFGWWHRPPSEGAPYQRPNNVGHQRIGIRVPNAVDAHRELVERGVTPFSEPIEIEANGPVKTFCFRDPDGVGLQVVEVPEGPNPSERRVQFVSTVVSDLDTALNLYRDVMGMTVVAGPFQVEGSNAGRLYGLSGQPNAAASAVWLQPGGEYEDPTLVELVHWRRPMSSGFPYGRRSASGGSFANHVGIVRTAFNVLDYESVYEELIAHGVQFVSPPQVTAIGGPEVAYCCWENYDGTILQLYSSYSGTEEEYREQLLGQLSDEEIRGSVS